MKVTKTVVVPASQYEALDYIMCELCNAVTTNEESWITPSSLADICETTIQLKIGYGSAEGGHTISTVVDICPSCFQDKLLPWIVENGGKTRQHEIDW